MCIRDRSADPKHLGARIGYICVLHTWGSRMNYHPHLHTIVLGGGLDAANTVSYTHLDVYKRQAFDHGITHFDLANNYGPVPGSAEENFGRILAKGLGRYRDELIISTKAGYDMWPGPYGNWGSKKYLVDSLDQSLKRM